MNFAKNTVAASALALFALFSSSANAEISGDQIVPKIDAVLAQAVQSPNAAFNQCVRENFVMQRPGDKPPMLAKLYDGILLRVATGLVDDDTTFGISVNSMLKKACGNSQLAGDEKSK